MQKLPGEGEVFAPYGAACLIRAEAFRENGGFDERFFCYVEDINLAFRLRLRGHRCIQVPAAVVRHVGTRSASPERTAFADECGTRNLIWCFVKCMPGPLFWPLLPLHILSVLLRAVCIGNHTSIRRGFLSAARNISGIWASRRVLHLLQLLECSSASRRVSYDPE